jgi:large subunit ribosomal protein L29
MKARDLRTKDAQELEFDLEHLRKELFELRFKAATESVANPAHIRQLRRDIARLRTVMREKGVPAREGRG